MRSLLLLNEILDALRTEADPARRAAYVSTSIAVIGFLDHMAGNKIRLDVAEAHMPAEVWDNLKNTVAAIATRREQAKAALFGFPVRVLPGMEGVAIVGGGDTYDLIRLREDGTTMAPWGVVTRDNQGWLVFSAPVGLVRVKALHRMLGAQVPAPVAVETVDGLLWPSRPLNGAWLPLDAQKRLRVKSVHA